jgi:hypothetical protein
VKTPSTLTYRRRASALPFHLVSRVRRVLLGDGGAGALVGTGLLLAVGLALTYSAVRDIRAAVAPERLACGRFLEDAQPGRWVALEGCRLDLTGASSAWWSRRGASGAGADLLVPLTAGQGGGPVRVVLATKSPAVATLAASLDALEPRAIDEVLAARAGELGPVLAPTELRGLVMPLEPRAGAPTPEGVLVLGDGQRARLATLGRLVAGLLVMLFAFWPVARRFQLERESSAFAAAGQGDPTRSAPGD